MNHLSDVLLIIDLQNGVCTAPEKSYHLDHLLTTLNKRILHYDMHKKPIIFIQHVDEYLKNNSYEYELLSSIHQPDHSIFIQKTHANSFFQTNLQATLNDLHCQSLEIWGAQTEYCVDTTTKVAHGLGYQLTMWSGGTTTYDTAYMTAKQTVDFYEAIWKDRFVTLLNEKKE